MSLENVMFVIILFETAFIAWLVKERLAGNSKDKQELQQDDVLEPIKKGVYRHYKGKYYNVFGEATQTETGERMVVYQSLYKFEKGLLWVRPKWLFLSPKELDDGSEVARFEYMPEWLPGESWLGEKD